MPRSLKQGPSVRGPSQIGGVTTRLKFQLKPPMVLDGAHLPSDSSIRDFQYGRAGYVANAIELALLLPVDMADLRGMRNHEMFLSFKRDLALISPSTNFLTLKVITMFSLSFFFFFFFPFFLH